jgi:hypothetical protein
MFAILFGVMLLSVVGCGDSAVTATGNSAGDASASFKINWHNSPDQSDNLSALNLDCAAEGVATVLCEIYDADGTWLASGGPWPCSTGAGKITRIPPGPRRTFVIFGLDEHNQIVYQGQSAEIDLEPGDNNDAGTIEAFPFRPVQTAPADSAQLPPGPLSLSWEPLNNASAYRVVVSTDSAFAEGAVIVDAVVTGQTAYTLDEYSPGTYYYWQIRAIDRYGNESAPSDPLRQFRTHAPPDLEPPVVAFGDPTGRVETGNDTIDIQGTASDNVGVVQVSWANDRGGSGICTGTEAWSRSAILLYSGTNIITVTARDAAGNSGSDTLTVIYTPPDPTPPSVAFTDPSGQVNTTINTIMVYGTASDNVGVAQVSWRNDRGGNGVFTGTTLWSGTIPLFQGTNVITAIARDAAGNTATDTLTVIYTLVWQSSFDGAGRAYSVQAASDGGYVVSGDNEAGAAFLLKLDAYGNDLWYRPYGGVEDDTRAYAVQATADGGYIVAGYTYIAGLNYPVAYVVKTDSSGNLQWENTYEGGDGNAAAYSVQATPDGGYIIAGSSWSSLYLLKIDADGVFQWDNIFSGPTGYGASATSLQVTSDGGYIITGSVSTIDGTDVYLLRTNAAGEMVWQRSFGGGNYDVGNFVQVTPDGGYIIAGTTSSYGNGSYYVYLIKTDAVGVSEWEKTFGGLDYDEGHCVQVTPDGGYIVAGSTYSYGNGEQSDIYLIKTDADGELLWQRALGEGLDVFARSVLVAPDGGYVVAGYDGVEGSFVYVIKTDAHGYIE